MGDDEDGTSPHEAVQPPLDELLRPGIDGGGGLVQDQHRGLGDRRPGNGQQLPLALGEVGPVGGQHGLIALGQVGDEVVGVGNLGRPDAVLVRGLQPPVADVLHHRAGEEVGILQDGAERAAEVVLPDLADVDAVVGDAAALDVVEAVDEVGDGGLAGAGGAHEGDLLPRLRVEGEVLEHGLFRHVGEVHPVEADIAPEGHPLTVRLHPEVVPAHVFQGDFPLIQLRRHIQHVEDALGAGQGQHDGVELLGDLAHPLGKVPDVAQEGDEHAAGVGPAEPQHAHGAGQGVEKVGEVIEDGPHDGGDGGGLRGGAAEVLVDGLKVRHHLGLVGEDLHVPLPGDHLL